MTVSSPAIIIVLIAFYIRKKIDREITGRHTYTYTQASKADRNTDIYYRKTYIEIHNEYSFLSMRGAGQWTT